MIQERTIAVRKEDVALSEEYLKRKVDSDEYNRKGKVELHTKFGADIKVVILVDEERRQIIGTLYYKGVPFDAVVKKNHLLDTYSFKDGNDEYKVHVRTHEDLEQEELEKEALAKKESASTNKMKFYYYNDTGRTVGIHPAMESYGVECNTSTIQHGEVREFLLPEGSVPLMKMWDHQKHGGGLQLLIMPHYDQMI